VGAVSVAIHRILSSLVPPPRSRRNPPLLLPPRVDNMPLAPYPNEIFSAFSFVAFIISFVCVPWQLKRK
jgi:hypothetical protein